MKSKKLYLALVIVIIVGIFSFAATIKPTGATTGMVAEDAGWIDNFDSETLDGRWSWIRENPTHWSLAANPGNLRLVTKGFLHLDSNNLENILLFMPSVENFRITTKVTFSPTENYQAAGLLVYQDDDNYIELSRVYSNGGNVRIKQENDGVFSTSMGMGVSDPTTYLRLDKVDNDYYGFYSIDGDDWEFAGQYNQNLSDIYIGLMGSDGLTITEDIVDFDYFEFTPRTYNKTWEDGFNSATLNSAWSWINEDPTHWSLTDNPGSMHITTQPGGIFAGVINNLLVTEAPSKDYQITTKVTISPTEAHHGAALIVYGDVDNYIWVSRRFSLSNDVNFRQESDDVLVVNTGYDETATTVYLRITKDGNVYSGYYSLDGNSYIYIGHTTAVFTNPKVGILSQSGPSTIEIPSDYDFFRLETNVNWSYLPLIVK